tara:strand:- start:145 stop:291 length:147 start_codon:yes stop_codon:yes gene_type:complete
MEDDLDRFSKEGVVCPDCGIFNTHEECGTYQVMNPACKNCGESTGGYR